MYKNAIYSTKQIQKVCVNQSPASLLPWVVCQTSTCYSLKPISCYCMLHANLVLCLPWSVLLGWTLTMMNFLVANRHIKLDPHEPQTKALITVQGESRAPSSSWILHTSLLFRSVHLVCTRSLRQTVLLHLFLISWRGTAHAFYLLVYLFFSRGCSGAWRCVHTKRKDLSNEHKRQSGKGQRSLPNSLESIVLQRKCLGQLPVICISHDCSCILNLKYNKNVWDRTNGQ